MRFAAFIKRLNLLCFICTVLLSAGVVAFSVQTHMEEGEREEREHKEFEALDLSDSRLDSVSNPEQRENLREALQTLRAHRNHSKDEHRKGQLMAWVLGGLFVLVPFAYIVLVNGLLGWLFSGKWSLGFRLGKERA